MQQVYNEHIFCVLVAQLDRVSPSEGEGREFESRQARQINRIPILGILFYLKDEKGLEHKKSPVKIITEDMIGNQSYFTAFFNKAPALNLGALLAAILISLPVAGLRPLRAARFVTANVPKPVN